MFFLLIKSVFFLTALLLCSSVSIQCANESDEGDYLRGGRPAQTQAAVQEVCSLYFTNIKNPLFAIISY